MTWKEACRIRDVIEHSVPDGLMVLVALPARCRLRDVDVIKLSVTHSCGCFEVLEIKGFKKTYTSSEVAEIFKAIICRHKGCMPSVEDYIRMVSTPSVN